MSPQQVNNSSYNYKVDIWALGVLAYEMLVGTQPFRARTLNQLRSGLETGTYEFPAGCNISIECLLFIIDCLQYNEEDRISIGELAEHPFLADVDEDEKARKAFIYEEFVDDVIPPVWVNSLHFNGSPILLNTKDGYSLNQLYLLMNSKVNLGLNNRSRTTCRVSEFYHKRSSFLDRVRFSSRKNLGIETSKQ